MKSTLIALTASFTLIAAPMLAQDVKPIKVGDDRVRLTEDDGAKKAVYAGSANPGAVAAGVIGGLLLIGLAAGGGSDDDSGGGSAGGTN